MPARRWLCPARPLPARTIPARRYTDIISYDRPAAQAYADTYALSYNPTFVSFAGADCANFASQCARAGDMPQSRGATTSGWWYDKEGTSSPWDDTYSLSWINCTRQIGYWNTRRTDWETSAGMLSRGDFIYYDWSGDGVWDHVAVVAGSQQRRAEGHRRAHHRPLPGVLEARLQRHQVPLRQGPRAVGRVTRQSASGTRSWATRSSAVSLRLICTSRPAAVTANAAAVGRALYGFIISSV